MFAQFGKGGSVVFLLTRYARPFFSRMMNFGGRALSDRTRRGRNLFLEMEYFFIRILRNFFTRHGRRRENL